ncbi:unnamed protein product [Prunus armeniaca]|uniref:Uncharacterized protein n=1 Tax=Prunus armeniaca TaxID=36596 RepID=A0A6J5VJR3_PRUAR|nr:unnamed protein product [Prunus armeniaca]
MVQTECDSLCCCKEGEEIYRRRTKFVKDDGRASFHFTYGVYAAPSDSSHYMESRWNGIKLFKK